ncbi:hypothetical protein B0H17DRAFT_1151771 [Mycena rosella]|uniref:Uncharacterized protein n=1 Tax=Mycena rosella TaxID=1033263 RepID=A0AAD7BI52_MYCRO|nr:hypothetical protein B0H17DRAFT_1151771 [Mycena rosella]
MLISDLHASGPSAVASTSRSLTNAQKSKRKKDAKPLEHSKVLILTEKTCYIAAINRVYGNPPLSTTTLDCITAKGRLPCSLCAARDEIELDFPSPRLLSGTKLPLFTAPPAAAPLSAAEKKLRLTKKEREQVQLSVIKFGESVRRAERKNATHQDRPKSSYLPMSLIKSILDNLLSLDSITRLEPLVQRWVFATGHRVRLYAALHTLRATINSQRETERLKRKEKRRATRAGKKAVYDSESESANEDQEESSSGDEEVDEHPRSSPIPPPPKHSRKVLKEVTNQKPSTRARVTRAARKPLQGASEVAQSYGVPYRTSSGRRAAKAAG